MLRELISRYKIFLIGIIILLIIIFVALRYNALPF